MEPLPQPDALKPNAARSRSTAKALSNLRRRTGIQRKNSARVRPPAASHLPADPLMGALAMDAVEVVVVWVLMVIFERDCAPSVASVKLLGEMEQRSDEEDVAHARLTVPPRPVSDAVAMVAVPALPGEIARSGEAVVMEKSPSLAVTGTCALLDAA